MKIKRIKETCLYIHDVEKTRAFYEGLLQLPVISSVPEKMIFFRAGESVLLCFVADVSKDQSELPPHGATGPIHFGFEVSKYDYDEILALVKNAAIEILHEQVWKNGIRSFYFHDPDKNLVEVLEEGLWD